MPAITASMVAELRAKTDAPMMECKKALTEADGDLNRAEEILRVKLGNKASKASSRIAAEGVVAASVSGTTGSLLEVNCETDFVTTSSPRTIPSWPSPRPARLWWPSTTRPTWLRWPRCRGRAAAVARRLRPDGRRRAQGPRGQDRREHVVAPLQALRRWWPTGQLPARHAHRRDRRVHRRRCRSQGRGDARGRHEAQGAGHRRCARRLDRSRAPRRGREGGRGLRRGRGRRQGRAVTRNRGQARRRLGAEVPEGGFAAQSRFRCSISPLSRTTSRPSSRC